MSNFPLVSVHMITYNHELHIAKAIEGVLNQKTDFFVELVIGEDCSTDNTRHIVSEYQRRFPHIIKVITSNDNVGMIKNSIRTALACEGKYIAYCEGDDYWHNPDKLQVQVDFLEQNPEYGMVHSNANLFNTSTDKLHVSYLNLSPDLDDDNAYFEILTDKRHVFTPTVCLRRDFLVNILDNNSECINDNYLMGDIQIWLEISYISKVKYLSDSLATYNLHEESATQSKDFIKLLRFEISFKDIITYYLYKYDCSEDVKKNALSRITPTLLRLAICVNDRNIIMREYSELKNLEIEYLLNYKERFICYCSDSEFKFSLVIVLKKIWAIIKKWT